MLGVAKSISEIHKKNAAENARDHKLCENYANFTKFIAIAIPISYHSLTAIYQLPAFLSIFLSGTICPSMHIYLPGANQLDTTDMIVLLIINVIFAIIGMTILFASDTFIFINFTTIPMFSTIVQRQIDDFKKELMKVKRNTGDVKLIKKQLIEIIQMQLKYNEYKYYTDVTF